MKYEIVSAQEYPIDQAFKFCIRLLEDQTILENDYANLIKECAKLKRTYKYTAFMFGVRDSKGYLFWMNYTDQRRALFLEDLDDPEFINKWFDMYRETKGFNPEVNTNLIENVTGVFLVGTVVEIILRNNKFMYIEDVHFKADKPWTQLSQIQKNHQHECETCAYPYYNDLPEEEALLTIRSHLLEKDMKVSPYQHLFVTAENFQLGVMDRYSHMNLYYLNHVKKIKKDLTLHCKIN